jgi:excisionase family DNA binding protein
VTQAPYYIRKDRAAELLDLSQRTLNRYIADGQLPEYELPGGQKRVKHHEVLGLPRRRQEGQALGQVDA